MKVVEISEYGPPSVIQLKNISCSEPRSGELRIRVKAAGVGHWDDAVQMSRNAGMEIFATASSKDIDYVRSLRARTVIDYRQQRFEDLVRDVDLVVDTVGGETRARSIKVLKPGGMLVSVVSPPTPEELANESGVKVVFFIVDVTTARLRMIAKLFDSKKLVPQVGTGLPLNDARIAHEMLAGAPHARGKIVLNVSV